MKSPNGYIGNTYTNVLEIEDEPSDLEKYKEIHRLIGRLGSEEKVAKAQCYGV